MESIDKILNLMSNDGITAQQLSQRAGISNGLITQWKQHKQNPSVKNLKKIAKYFNVPWESLMPEDEVDWPATNAINEAIRQFNNVDDNRLRTIYLHSGMVECLGKINMLNRVGIKKVLEYADDLLASGKYTKK